jgi:hypothetical protein
MCRSHWLAAVLSALVLLPRPSAAAERFDLIYTNRFDITVTPITGLQQVHSGFALLVNTGALPLTAAEVSDATFTCTSSVAGFTLRPFVMNLPDFAPIAPAEAVGSVIAQQNGVLLNLVQPSETFRNTQPSQVLTFSFMSSSTPYVGPVTFDIVMRLGGQEAHFQIEANVQPWIDEFSVSFPSAARVSSTGVVATESTTWGKLKALYR